MKKYSIFWGLVLFGCGVLLLLIALGIGTSSFILPLIGSIILGAISLTSLTRLNFVGVTLPLVGIAYLWKEELGLLGVNFWLLLLAAVLLGGGLSIIFRKFRRKHFQDDCCQGKWKSGESTMISSEDEFVKIESNFGDHSRYIRSDNLKKVDIDSNFSAVKVYFEQSVPSPEGLTIVVDCNFSGVFLYIPRNWSLQNRMVTFAGAVEGVQMSSGECIPVSLVGDVNFGSVKVIYV